MFRKIAHALADHAQTRGRALVRAGRACANRAVIAGWRDVIADRVVFVLAALGLASAAQAQTVCQTVGASRTCNGPGVSSTTTRLGATTVTTFSDGRTVTCQKIGVQRVCN